MIGNFQRVEQLRRKSVNTIVKNNTISRILLYCATILILALIASELLIQAESIEVAKKRTGSSSSKSSPNLRRSAPMASETTVNDNLNVTGDLNVNGNILPRMSQWFKLSSVQGQRTLMRLSTDSIDSKLNPIMILRNESGGRISRADRSGLIDYTATSNGDLYLQIHDASFAGGVDFFFRVGRGGAWGYT